MDLYSNCIFQINDFSSRSKYRAGKVERRLGLEPRSLGVGSKSFRSRLCVRNSFLSLSVSVSVHALTFEILDIETSFLVYR